MDGVPGRIRTCDAGIRSPALYPLSYGDPLESHGRGGGIRTPDPLLPKQVRYQAALRPVGDTNEIITMTLKSQSRCRLMAMATIIITNIAKPAKS